MALMTIKFLVKRVGSYFRQSQHIEKIVMEFPVGSQINIFFRIIWSVNLDLLALADLGGRDGRTPPLTGPNSFVFTYIFTKKCPLTGPSPPTGNPGSATG